MAKEKRQDFILNPDGDFPLQDAINPSDGSISPTRYGDSDQQHIQDIIEDGIGATKSFPTLGFGVEKYLNSEFNLNDVNKRLKSEMNDDDYEVKNGAIYPAKGGGFVIDTNKIERK